ncbi:MAG TPA: PA2169 family four-helix-bundle protein [Acidobacteriaceae bacterium]|jgi:uncharacterized protein (TIGR02284 family)|nr:PA2169 family four-helix-bundle protein [Acidobacteriaceae bacterium]
MSDNLEQIEKILRSVIETLEDGYKGFAESGKEFEDATIKTFFLEESQVRARFASELENELSHLSVKRVRERGTTTRTLHRTWAEVKAHLGGGDHTLLVTAEQGENRACEAYERSLKENLPADVEEVLKRQQQYIIQSHAKVRMWRDAACC